MPIDIKSRVIEDNVKVHAVEAGYYDVLHQELMNGYVLKNLNKDIDFVLSSFGSSSPRVLDIGAGTGYTAIPFLKKGCFVDMVDISPEMLNLCRQKVDKLGLGDKARFFVSEAEQFLSNLRGEEYSVIVISSFLHHLYDYMKLLGELDNHLAPGGIIFIAWEPTSQRYARFSSLAKVVDFIDNRFFGVYMKKHNILIPDTEYKFSDYYANSGKGCDPNAIIDDFKKKHYSVLKFKNFSGLAKSALAARIHNYFKLSCDHFRLIMRKTNE